MAHDVFISYSLKDKPTADAACVALETKGIRCWVAPRDIVPGRDWGASIIEAIKGSRAMVLIFSANANTSAQIKREVERAVNKGVPVIPFRIEDVAPSDTLEYFISTPHWLDAFTPPLEPHLAYLAEVARQIVGGPDVSPAEVAKRESREKAKAETATLAEEERKAAKLAKLKLADEKKATEAAKVARLVRERRNAEQEARLEEKRRRAAEAGQSTGVEKPSVAERRGTSADEALDVKTSEERFKCKAVKRWALWVHMDCYFRVTATGLEFVDKLHPQYSFVIPKDRLRGAEFTKPKGFLGSDDDLLIILSDGSEYEIGFDSGNREKALAAINGIL